MERSEIGKIDGIFHALHLVTAAAKSVPDSSLNWLMMISHPSSACLAAITHPLARPLSLLSHGSRSRGPAWFALL